MPLESHDKTHILEEVVKKFAQKTYRTLLCAYVDYEKEDYSRLSELTSGFKTEEAKEKTEANLVVAGIFGLVDPLRDGIKAAVERCHKSGINVRMCTGDNIDTATAISLEAGIITR